METGREFDVVVLGATGFTGRHVAHYLAQHGPGLRWSIAGRDPSRLRALAADLQRVAPGGSVACLAADLADAASLRRMASAARVVLTTAGPFIDHGPPVVDACLASGADYLDSSGEYGFVGGLFKTQAAEAARRGLRLVPSCGFDSVIADLCSHCAVRELDPEGTIDARGYVAMRAAFSGGTQRSAIKSLRAPVPLLGLQAVEGDRRVGALRGTLHRPGVLPGWAAAFPTIDSYIVTRTAAVLPCYGRSFTYAHHAMHDRLWQGLLALTLFGGLSRLGRSLPLATLMLRAANQPGTGPKLAQLASHWFRVAVLARQGTQAVCAEISGGDPAYLETAKILGESALCLARDRHQLPDRTGVLTPVLAMGDRLRTRLQAAGLPVEIHPAP